MPSTPLLAAFLLVATPAVAQEMAAPSGSSADGAAPQGQTRGDAAARAEDMFNRFDLNHDGFVTIDEMTAFVAARMPKTANGKLPKAPPMVRAMFDDGDTNHDGKVSLEEARASALRGFDEADTNHDGIVTPEEQTAEQARVMNEPAPKSTVGR